MMTWIFVDKLYFCSSEPPELKNDLLPWIPFINDSSLIYTAFFADFGPLDLGLTCKFCQQLHEALTNATNHSKAIIYFAGNSPQKRANNAVLLCSYLVSMYILSTILYYFYNIPSILRFLY